jgi:DNA helicase-2/ATP-dependent DNA helicase PcrA
MFESLSVKQKEIVYEKSGKFVVRACPGSGKTYCVSARLARLISEWKKPYQGVSAVSFTNVAWQEIEKKHSKEFQGGDKISFPHFLGTIDSFVNKYIFLPYGHLILKCNKRPTLVGEPHGIWSGGRYERDPNQYFDICSFDINGELFPTGNPQSFHFSWKNNNNGSVNGNVLNLLESKKSLLGKGYANQADANYFAMKILETFPCIAKAIAFRFPFLIVDEAQDTSAIQMRIIDLLISNGLSEIMLVGDPDQAIFEWNDARPDLLNQKFNEWKNSIVLNESRRSSQRICNFTYNISSLDTPSTAVSNDVKDFIYQPKVLVYNDNLPQVVEAFIAVCEQNEIQVSKKTAAVIYRSNSVYNEITGQKPIIASPWLRQDNYTKDFAKGKFLYDQGDFKGGFKAIEKAILKQVGNLSFSSEDTVEKMIDKIGFIKFKSQVFKFINSLPKTDTNLGNWIAITNAFLTQNIINFQLRINNEGANYSFSQIFINESEAVTERDYRLGTVHSVKGETFDAILLILKTKGIGKAYKTILNQNVSISESEELRIAYVGMTRPKKVLIIAVPNDEDKLAWEKKLYGES